MEKWIIFFEVKYILGKVFFMNGVTTTGQPVDKDKIGSISHFAHRDKFKMDVKKNTLLVLKNNKKAL